MGPPMGKKVRKLKAQKSPQQLQEEAWIKEFSLNYAATESGAPLDARGWNSWQIHHALATIKGRILSNPTSATSDFYDSLFSQVNWSTSPLQLHDAAGNNNVHLLQSLVKYCDPKANNSLALRHAVQHKCLKTARVLFPLSDARGVAGFCVQQAARWGDMDLFTLFEPLVDWKADDCYTARFCALRCADSVLEQKENPPKGKKHKTPLPVQYQMLIAMIRKNDYAVLEERLAKLTHSLKSNVSERGKVAWEISTQAYQESVLKERLMEVVGSDPAAPRRSKI